MIKAKTISQQVALISGNKRVYEYVSGLLERQGLKKVAFKENEGYEIEDGKVLVTIMGNKMYACNVYGSVFEDFTRKDCKLKVLNVKEKVTYVKKN